MTAALKVAEALEGNGLKKLDIGGLPTAADYWAFSFGVGAGITILIVSFGLVFLVAALFK